MPDRTIVSGHITHSSDTALTIKVSDNYTLMAITSATKIETSLDVGNHITAYIDLGKVLVATKIQAYDPERNLQH